MKSIKKNILLLILLSGFLFSQQKEEKQTLSTKKEKLSYAIGVDIGNNIKMQKLELDTKIILDGINNAIANEKLLLSDEEINQLINDFQNSIIDEQKKELENLKNKNLEEGKDFLSKNALKEGVVVLQSGLQYKIIENGKGKKPTVNDTVLTNYKGTLIDGSEFDSSYDDGVPAEFPIIKVIKGFAEALQLMNEGSKWQIFIPAELAYGEKGKGKIIGPNTVLLFDLELIKIK